MSKNNIAIDIGEKRITINDDPDRVLVFNPSDIIFAERFYDLIRDFEKQMTSYRDRMVEIELVVEKDDHGLFINASDRLSIVKEVCKYVNDKIDGLFGEGTSLMLFQGAVNLDAYTQFFTGLIPFIKETRKKKVQKYVQAKPAKMK